MSLSVLVIWVAIKAFGINVAPVWIALVVVLLFWCMWIKSFVSMIWSKVQSWLKH